MGQIIDLRFIWDIGRPAQVSSTILYTNKRIMATSGLYGELGTTVKKVQLYIIANVWKKRSDDLKRFKNII